MFSGSATFMWKTLFVCGLLDVKKYVERGGDVINTKLQEKSGLFPQQLRTKYVRSSEKKVEYCSPIYLYNLETFKLLKIQVLIY